MYTSDIKKYLFLEPTIFLFNLAHEIANLVDMNLYLQKTCRNYTRSAPDLSTPCDNERNGIEFVASINSRFILWGGICTLIMVVLMAAWIDKAPNRSKFSVIISMCIRLLQMLSMCCQAYFWYWPVMAAVFTEMIFIVVFCTRVASIIYICQSSSIQDRTYRLTLLYMIELLSSIVGNGASGFILRNLGFFYSYMLCAILNATAVTYAILFWKNPIDGNTNTTPRGCIKATCEFLDGRSIMQAFRVVLRKRSGNERILIILMSIISILAMVCFIGESTVLYLYLRYRFGWNEKDYGIFGLYKTAGICVGLLICSAISKCIKIEDCALGLFAAFFDTLASMGYYYVEESWQLYFVLLLDIFHGFAVRVCVPIQSKFFKSEEYGQLFSVHMSVDIFIVLLLPLYSLLFRNTMDFAANSIFILSFSINISVVLLYGISYLLIRKIPKTE